ncbi:hypothetical protein diail_10511 [Diaporthe ilicicola]|nr:hypothetical protein diail_10511 [Diaporthe ilicicola]
MDSPAPGVIKDSQPSRPNITPKSADFGSPLATQNPWTAPPRRRQVQQKAKASFLHDDKENKEDPFNDVATSHTDHHDDAFDLDFTSLARELDQYREPDDDPGGDNPSPTPRSSQAARLPPRSAQLDHKGSGPESSGLCAFEDLKKRPATTAASNDPSKPRNAPQPSKQKQTRALAPRGKTATEAKKEPPAKTNATGPKKAPGKSLANSKVRLTALEVEMEPDTGELDVQEPRDYDYSLPASNSSSPAKVPHRKRAAAKRQPAKKPAPKPKQNEPKAKSAAVGRPKKTRPAGAAPPIHESPEADSSHEENTEDVAMENEPVLADGGPEDASTPPEMKERTIQSSKPAAVDLTQDIVMVSSGSSESSLESDNTDDKDFECSSLTIPSARRKTRAAAQVQAAREASRHNDGQPSAVSKSRRREIEDEEDHVDAAEEPKRQPKNPPKTSATAKTTVVAPRGKPGARPKDDTMSFAAGHEEKSAKKLQPAANHTTKSNSENKGDVVLPPEAKPAKTAEANDLGQSAAPVKTIKNSNRKPVIVAFGLDGPKNSGRLHNSKTTTDSRPEGQQLGPSPRDYPAARNIPSNGRDREFSKKQLSGMEEDSEKASDGCVGQDEGRSFKSALASHSIVERKTPSSAFHTEVDTRIKKPDADVEVTEPPYTPACIAAPAVTTHTPKRKLQQSIAVQESSPRAPRTHADLPSEKGAQVVKKPRYNLAHAVRNDQDASCASNLVRESGRISQSAVGTSSDDIFVEKKNRPARSTAFVQKLTSNESADCAPVQARVTARDLVDIRRNPRKHPDAIHWSTTDRSAAPDVLSRPHASQASDEIAQKVRVALALDKTEDCEPWLPGDDTNAKFINPFDQRTTSEIDSQMRAWKKASEPYADSLGETMHKIVNTLLRGLKTKEAAIEDVIRDYQMGGNRIVERMADKHRKERAQITQEQEQNRLGYVQTYGKARRRGETLRGRLESVDIDKMMSSVGKDETANRLKQLQQAFSDA